MYGLFLVSLAWLVSLVFWFDFYYSFYINRNKITVFRFQLDLITKQNNEDTNKVLLNRSGDGFRVCNELGVLG